MESKTQKEIPKKKSTVKKNKKKRALSKFALLRCLETYFVDDHDQALALMEYIWENKDKY